MLLYIPAMVYPMMVVTQFGVNLESTIIEGIISFLEHGSYFIAFVIFLASVAIPIVKLFALFFIFLSLKINVKMTNKTKILIYKYIEAIGKWSMIDIYVVALMASIVQLDELFNIKGGVAATSFSLMVIITIFAAHRFDTRIIWDEKEISENINEPVVYLAKERESNKISPVWILPLIILGILAFIAYDTYSKKGTNIVVYFKSAEGLKENVTTLEYKGLALGKVTKISMHDDLKNVAVNILVNSDVAEYVANEGSKFWIKKPTVSLTKISGLSTLISGYKIELSPNFKIENAKPQWYFTGLDSAPDDEFEENGYYISLLMNDKDNVDVGTPIFYNKYQIGEIVSKEFKNEQLYASAYIYDKYNYLVNKSSKFIMNEALKVNYGASGLNIEVSSLYSALVGGITVVTSIKDDSKIEKNEIYTLFSSKDDLRKKSSFYY